MSGNDTPVTVEFPPVNCGPRLRGRILRIAKISWDQGNDRGQPHADQADPRITLQKLPRLKVGSLSARTSALTLPNVVSGLLLMPS
jgi:hypothetical protein